MLDPGHPWTDAHMTSAGVNTLPPGHSTRDIHVKSARGTALAGGHTWLDTQASYASGDTLPTAKPTPAATHEAPSGTNRAEGQGTCAAHEEAALGSTLPPTMVRALPSTGASAATISQPTIKVTTPRDSSSAAFISDPGHCTRETPVALAGADLHDAILGILAASLDDLERTRIATQNRIRALRDDQGLADSPFEKKLISLFEGLKALEHQATLDLQRAMRLHPLHGFVKQTRGLGLKQAARLLAAIGDPAARANPAKLWQYSGHGDPARSRKRRGEVVQFNPTAKMRAHLCAESMLRAGNREVYDRERAKWADRDTSDGHKHNHALRVVAKTLLLDLWKFAKAAQEAVP